MAVDVVDLLELIDVNAQHRKRGIASRQLQRVCDALGDVLVGRNPAAVLRRPGAPVACRMPGGDRSRWLTARENPGESLRRRDIVRSSRRAVSGLRPDDRKCRRACGAWIAIAGVPQRVQGNAKIDIAGLQAAAVFM